MAPEYVQRVRYANGNDALGVFGEGGPDPVARQIVKLKAKGLVERIGKTRRYRLTPIGLKLGVLLVKLRTRFLGPLASLIRQSNADAAPRRSNPVDAAYGEIDTALDHLSVALGLKPAA